MGRTFELRPADDLRSSHQLPTGGRVDLLGLNGALHDGHLHILVHGQTVLVKVQPARGPVALEHVVVVGAVLAAHGALMPVLPAVVADPGFGLGRDGIEAGAGVVEGTLAGSLADEEGRVGIGEALGLATFGADPDEGQVLVLVGGDVGIGGLFLGGLLLRRFSFLGAGGLLGLGGAGMPIAIISVLLLGLDDVTANLDGNPDRLATGHYGGHVAACSASTGIRRSGGLLFGIGPLVDGRGGRGARVGALGGGGGRGRGSGRLIGSVHRLNGRATTLRILRHH
mmetsp:Transcript_22237/g.63807  ORF Transcript_22237/g.63807 Transcript_22237/m.63807 type:complete len:283 (+) Transcript_22237:1349-2197(+)